MDGKSRNGKLYVNLKLIKFKKLSILGYSRKKKKKNREEGGGVGIWNFQGYWRNNKWNIQGLIKNNIEFPGVIRIKSCGISRGLGFKP